LKEHYFMDEGLSKSLLKGKEIGLKSVLSNGWGPKNALEMKKIRPESALSDGWELENVVE
jgi:hypothetical protein